MVQAWNCLYIACKLRTDHLTWKGGGLWFFFSFRNFFSDNTRVRIFFFCRAKREICFQNLTLDYMTKTLNQIIFFSSTKIIIFISATLGIRIFFRSVKNKAKRNGDKFSPRLTPLLHRENCARAHLAKQCQMPLENLQTHNITFFSYFLEYWKESEE